jgi:hypothetical protein
MSLTGKMIFKHEMKVGGHCQGETFVSSFMDKINPTGQNLG